jgi:hypothetical protein
VLLGTDFFPGKGSTEPYPPAAVISFGGGGVSGGSVLVLKGGTGKAPQVAVQGRTFTQPMLSVTKAPTTTLDVASVAGPVDKVGGR